MEGGRQAGRQTGRQGPLSVLRQVTGDDGYTPHAASRRFQPLLVDRVDKCPAPQIRAKNVSHPRAGCADKRSLGIWKSKKSSRCFP